MEGSPCNHRVISGIVVAANNSFLQKNTIFVSKILWFRRRNFISIIVSFINRKLKLGRTWGHNKEHWSHPWFHMEPLHSNGGSSYLFYQEKIKNSEQCWTSFPYTAIFHASGAWRMFSAKWLSGIKVLQKADTWNWPCVGKYLRSICGFLSVWKKMKSWLQCRWLVTFYTSLLKAKSHKIWDFFLLCPYIS